MISHAYVMEDIVKSGNSFHVIWWSYTFLKSLSEIYPLMCDSNFILVSVCPKFNEQNGVDIIFLL